MRSMKWFIPSLTKHDYLLGAMIVCLDLYYDSLSEASAEKAPEYDKYFWTPEQQVEMIQALERSEQIWKESANASMEAFKASKMIAIMLEKVRFPHGRPAEPTTSEIFAQFDDDNLRPEHSAAMTLGMLSGGLSPNSAAVYNSLGQSPRGTQYRYPDMNIGESSSSGLTPNYSVDASNPFAQVNVTSPFSVFGNLGNAPGMMDVPANLDWDAWDNFIQGNSIDPAFQNYPTNLDQAPDGQQPDPSSFGNGVFMGANTPPAPGR